MAKSKSAPVRIPARKDQAPAKEPSPAEEPEKPVEERSRSFEEEEEQAAKPVEPRAKRRFRPGTVALRQIKKYQKRDDLLIPRASFARLVREVAQEQGIIQDVRFQQGALEAIQEAAESLLVGALADSQIASIHRGKVTVFPRDLRHIMYLRTRDTKYAPPTLIPFVTKPRLAPAPAALASDDDE